MYFYTQSLKSYTLTVVYEKGFNVSHIYMHVRLIDSKVLRIRGAPVRQKLGMILENKVVQKLKLEKKCFLQKMVS